jgi:hypothetical protein
MYEFCVFETSFPSLNHHHNISKCGEIMSQTPEDTPESSSALAAKRSSRKSHRKSRNGCDDCKRRRIKVFAIFFHMCIRLSLTINSVTSKSRLALIASNILVVAAFCDMCFQILSSPVFILSPALDLLKLRIYFIDLYPHQSQVVHLLSQKPGELPALFKPKPNLLSLPFSPADPTQR